MLEEKQTSQFTERDRFNYFCCTLQQYLAAWYIVGKMTVKESPSVLTS